MKRSIEERCKQFVRNEVIYCVSALVSELKSLYVDDWPEDLVTILEGPVDEESDPEDSECREVFEHWIVSKYLADKLIEKGESVVKDFLGMTIWGRTTTGMAIAYDQVIVDIVNETGYHSGE